MGISCQKGHIASLSDAKNQEIRLRYRGTFSNEYRPNLGSPAPIGGFCRNMMRHLKKQIQGTLLIFPSTGNKFVSNRAGERRSS